MARSGAVAIESLYQATPVPVSHPLQAVGHTWEDSIAMPHGLDR